MPETFITIANVSIAGLEEEKKRWINICQTENIANIEIATKNYAQQIEEALSQPLSVILKKAQFTELNNIIIIDRDPGRNAMIRMRDDGATGKSLNEKAKSSLHGKSLAGYIPADQAFSKAGDDGRADYFNEDLLKRFAKQEKLDNSLNNIVTSLNNSKTTYEAQKFRLGQLLKTNPIVKEKLKDRDNREVFGYRDGDAKPVFAYKYQGLLYLEANNELISEMEAKKFKQIEVLAYVRGISLNKEGTYGLKTQKITGDHDQLAIGTIASRDNVIQSKELGSSDGYGHAVTAALIEETESSGAVRHSQDAGGAGTKNSLSINDLVSIANYGKLSRFFNKLGGNPYPEDFAPGNYAIYKSNGYIDVAHNEQEIIQKYNELEKLGYNIGINPRYGWERNGKNELQIDSHKMSAQLFNTEKKHLPKDLQKQAEKLYKMHSVLSLIKLQKSSPQKNNAIKVAEDILRRAENKYAKEYGLPPPTILAIINEDVKNVRLREIEAILKSPSNHNSLFKKISNYFKKTKISPTTTNIVRVNNFNKGKGSDNAIG